MKCRRCGKTAKRLFNGLHVSCAGIDAETVSNGMRIVLKMEKAGTTTIIPAALGMYLESKGLVEVLGPYGSFGEILVSPTDKGRAFKVGRQ